MKVKFCLEMEFTIWNGNWSTEYLCSDWFSESCMKEEFKVRNIFVKLNIDGSALKKYTNWDMQSCFSVYVFLLLWGNEKRQKPNIPHLTGIMMGDVTRGNLIFSNLKSNLMISIFKLPFPSLVVELSSSSKVGIRPSPLGSATQTDAKTASDAPEKTKRFITHDKFVTSNYQNIRGL